MPLSLCPNCLSHERHRLLAPCDAEQGLFTGKDILHFAPETGLTRYIEARKPRSYVTCGFGGKGADLDINIERIDLENDKFDLIICCHILEHVNDRLAMPELFRIFRKGGTLIAMIPLIEGWQETFEDRSRQRTVEDRILYFNQHDHVRFFGRDFRRRLERAGFVVDEYTGSRKSRNMVSSAVKKYSCAGRLKRICNALMIVFEMKPSIADRGAALADELVRDDG